MTAMGILAAGMTMARVAVARESTLYASAEYQRAGEALRASVAAQLQAGTPAANLTTPSPLAPACADERCAFRSSATFTLLPAQDPSEDAGCANGAAACAQSEERNPYISEGRLAARVAVTVTDAASHALQIRSGTIVLRVMSAPPYALVAGSGIGDDGGLPAATPNPCASPLAGDAVDTTVRVAYRNAVSGACTDGSSFSSGAYAQPSSAPPGWSP